MNMWTWRKAAGYDKRKEWSKSKSKSKSRYVKQFPLFSPESSPVYSPANQIISKHLSKKLDNLPINLPNSFSSITIISDRLQGTNSLHQKTTFIALTTTKIIIRRIQSKPDGKLWMQRKGVSLVWFVVNSPANNMTWLFIYAPWINMCVWE